MLDDFKARQPLMVEMLTGLIEQESFTPEKENVDALADHITTLVEPTAPSSITRLPQTEVGDMLLAKWNEDAPGVPIMVLMHMDTVHPAGSLANMPVRTDDEGRLFGPGSVDMKGGIAVALSALTGLQALGQFPERPIWYLFTSDEERGSKHALPYIEAYAPGCGLVLVMEFPTDEGALKTGRKGVATYTIETVGRPSHAGNHPERGINAVLEMAEQIVRINGLQDLRNGISVAVNTIEGGTASNVIAAHATASIDVRTLTQFDMDNIHAELMDLRPRIFGSEVNVTLNGMRGPMERDDTMAATFKQAKAIASNLGLTIYEETVGGGSDGNITAGLGVPTLDGLGPRGGGAHTHEEHVIVRSLPERAAHMAAMLRDWTF
jgi:glutamate carboxypeptidase